jgi:Family of unknown function (DUF6151)
MQENKYAIRCCCGSLEGAVTLPATTNRVICYCKDCRAFARFLGASERILDRDGGTDIVQMAQVAVTFTKGVEHLACMRLKPNGLNRWYARCCRTPIGNTARSKHPAFIGLIHSCMQSQTMDAAFGPVTCRVNSKSSSNTALKDTGVAALVFRFMAIVATGFTTKKASPFFAGDGKPASKPEILSASEFEKIS